MGSEESEVEKKKEVYVLIKTKPKYIEEFCIMMVACKGLCKRVYKSKNLANIDEVFSVLGPYDYLLELSGEGKGEEEKDEKINRTIFKIRETLGSYIYETCTLTKFELSKHLTSKELFEKAESLENEQREDELNDFKGFLEEGTISRLCTLRQEPDRVTDGIQNLWAKNKYLFSLKGNYTQDLNDCNLNDNFKKEFEDIGHPLSDKAKVSMIDEKNWKIVDDTKRYGIYSTDALLNVHKLLNVYKIITKDVHVLIEVKPEYTEKFFVAMTVFKSVCNRVHPSKNFAEIDEICSIAGPFDFLLKIIGEEKKIIKTILEIRETLGGYINETFTIEKFKIPMTKKELEKLFEKILGEKNLAKLPDKDGEKVPNERHKSDDKIDLKEMYDAETTALKNLLKKAKTFLELEDLNKRIVDLTNRIEELEKRS